MSVFQSVHFAGSRTNGLGVSAYGQWESFAMATHPTDVTGGDACHQRKCSNVADYHSAGAYECVLADSYATYDRAVGAKTCSSPDDGVSILSLTYHRRTGVVDIREHRAWPAKNVVFERNALVDRDIVLNFDVVSDDYSISNENILTQ